MKHTEQKTYVASYMYEETLMLSWRLLLNRGMKENKDETDV